MLLTIIS